ncbi:MAG: hypothetical protein EOP61_12895 [Sphingomonadales bacterium]|nr:MAG: hypothetical protein EOP61_12895 [Sphingomonadales bacterium]
MRLLKNLAAAAALASMAVTPLVAQAGAASKLSLRAVTKAKNGNKAAPAILIGVLATVAIVGGVIVLTDDSGSP